MARSPLGKERLVSKVDWQMTTVEAYVDFRPEVYVEGGEVTGEETAGFLRNFM